MPLLPVVGVDLSLTGTGLATAAGVRTVTSSGKEGATLRVRHARLTAIAAEVCLAVSEAAAPRTALVVIEGPTYATSTGHQHDRSGAWWLVVDELLGAGHLVAEVSPPSRAKYATGNGRAGKVKVASAVTARYGVTFDDDNTADAFVLRAMGLHRFGQPLAEVPKTHAAALESVQWPDVDLLAGVA